MGGDDDDAKQPHGAFAVGSPVEVLVNEEDMGGVYFSAIVVPPPRNSSTKNSGEKLYVRYHNLLARGGGRERLREQVDVSTLRPAPPRDTADRFQPGDIVDAFYRDGWWRGVVRRVVGAGERFLVTFENPPDEQEFGPAALRAHWDWADGVWAGPQKEGVVGNLVFEVGAKVEILLAGVDDYCKNALFPAEIVRDLEKGVYLVEFVDKKGDCVKAEIDSGNVRPSPPIFKERKFRAWERVDAFFDFGWWSGLIKKAVENGYIVFFEDTNLNKLFNPSELRPHVDWRVGKWFLTTDAVAGKSSPSLEKHNPQIENADEENEDQERRTKRIEDAQGWPFVKRSSVWEAVEAMKMPLQQPHFKPLQRFRESAREGLAIACMVNFANAVEASRGLSFGDPKSMVDDLLMTLVELEEQGFEVGEVRGRVGELAAAKEEEERLVEKARGMKEEMEERGWRRSRIEKELKTIDGHIGRLQEQLELAEIARAKEVEEIAHLQGGLEETKMQMESLRCEFEGVVASLLNPCSI